MTSYFEVRVYQALSRVIPVSANIRAYRMRLHFVRVRAGGVADAAGAGEGLELQNRGREGPFSRRGVVGHPQDLWLVPSRVRVCL